MKTSLLFVCLGLAAGLLNTSATLRIEVTIDDPGAFTTPYTFNRTHTLMPGADLLEYVCNEFNVDKDHLVGK